MQFVLNVPEFRPADVAQVRATPKWRSVWCQCWAMPLPMNSKSKPVAVGAKFLCGGMEKLALKVTQCVGNIEPDRPATCSHYFGTDKCGSITVIARNVQGDLMWVTVRPTKPGKAFEFEG